MLEEEEEPEEVELPEEMVVLMLSVLINSEISITHSIQTVLIILITLIIHEESLMKELEDLHLDYMVLLIHIPHLTLTIFSTQLIHQVFSIQIILIHH
jgi:hypothetical protein